MLADADQAREALFACNPNCPRDEWVRLAMAAKAAGVDADTFHAWSAQAPSYNEREAQAAWKSIKPAGGIGPGTLFKAAAQNGWRPCRPDRPARSQGNPAPVSPSKAPPSRQRGQGATEVWARCEAAPAEHPYILAKQGRPDGLRVVSPGDSLTIAGQRVAGWLAVPVVPLGAAVPVSLQFVPPPGTGKKLNLPGASVAGVFIVGELLSGCSVFLTEGIGQAWSCWKATGAAAVVCFGWGRVRTVAAELRERDTDARLVIVPDVGKEQEAQEIARQVRGQFVALPAGWEENADVNDYALQEGFDSLEVLLSKPREPEQRFKLLGADDLRVLPPMVWRIRDVLPAQGVACVYGPSASGKSFLALDMGAAIAEGREWFGYRAKPAPVVYVALEGEAGFSGRIRAWEQHHGRALPPELRMVLQPFKLTTALDVADLAAAVRALGDGAVVIIDTLNRAAPGADENASQDMGRILEAARELRAATAGLVLLVHHTGKDAAKGLRGHSSLFAALDAVVEVSREGSHREWKSAKVKDGDDGVSHTFRLVTVDLGDDADGEAVTSCAVAPDSSDGGLRRVLPPKSGNQRVVWDALGEMLLKAGPYRPAGSPESLPPGRPAVRLDAAVETLRERLAVDPKRKTERAQQALTGLQVLILSENWAN